MPHPNEDTLRALYDDFARGDLEAVLSRCADEIVFHIPGRSKLAGTYRKQEFGPGLIRTVMELTGGTFQETVDDVLANDRHGVVLATHRLQRDGRSLEYQTAHLWRFENGRLVEWWEYPQDLHQIDQVWA